MTITEFFGIAAGVLGVIPSGFYIYAILKGETKPDRVTWWILALESGLITVTYHGVGASETIWLPMAYTIIFTVVALFSIWYGDGPFHLHTLDRVCLVGALLSIVVWQSLDSAWLALLMNMVVEMLGLTPTFVKAYKRPETEDKRAWVIATIASLLNVLAIAPWTLKIALYPVYVLVTNAVLTYFLIRPRVTRVQFNA